MDESGGVPVMRVTVLRAPKGGDAGGMVAYYAGLVEDQLRRDASTSSNATSPAATSSARGPASTSHDHGAGV